MENVMPYVQILLTTMITAGTGVNFIIGLMLARQMAEMRSYINEKFVSKSDMRDLMQVFLSKERLP